MKLSTKDMTLVSLFAALTAVGAIIPGIPIGPVPITLQTFFTALAGVILGARLGMLSQIIYIIIGLIGIPVFSGFKGGVSAIYGPSFGYLIGFVISAYITGKIMENNNKNFIGIFLAIIVGYLVIYAVGIPYMYMIITKVMNVKITFYGALKSGLLVFIPGDLAKALLCSLIGVKILPALKSQMVSGN